MQLTLIGMVLFVASALVFVTGSTLALFALLLSCSLMGGSAAMILPALGGSSIAPMQFVLPFMVARILLAGRKELPRLMQAIRANAVFLAFVGYGIAAAVAAPRIFAGRINVPPLRMQASSYLFETVPLGPTPQNVTTTVYLAGTLLVAVAAYVAATRDRGAAVLVATGVVVSWLHIFLGVSDVLFGGTAYGAVLEFFRNATYAQLDQSYGNFVRIKGIFPEASVYAAFAFTWFVFMFECWFRHVRPRATGPAALGLALVLVFSTSTTAYVSLTAYSVLIVLRTLIAPQGLPADRLLVLAAAALVTIIAILGAVVLLPGVAAQFGDMISHVTIDKKGSASGLQRLFWSRKGIEGFWVSNGLGIGPGSFRSSSLFTAILGSCGIVGVATFAIYVLRVFKPLRGTTYKGSDDARLATGIAASWVTLAGLIPAGISGASTDPGLLFGVFAGCALALRRTPGPAVAAASRGHADRTRRPLDPFARSLGH